MDSQIRALERRLQSTNDPSDALALYWAKKRSGDKLAGPWWYVWQLDYFESVQSLLYNQTGEREYLVPDSDNPRVWWLHDFDAVYCDECGFELASENIEIPESDFDLWPAWALDHPDAPEWRGDERLQYLLENHSEHLQQFLYRLSRMGRGDAELDRDMICECGLVIKLDTSEIGWREIFA